MTDINDLFQRCMNKQGFPKKTITASTVYGFVKSPFNVWCDYFAPEGEKDSVPEYLKVLFERGMEHEEKTRKQLYPDLVSVKFKTLEEGFQIALQSFTKGVTTMTSVPIFYLPESLMSIPDIVERSDSHKSIFGRYHYIIKDIKSAKNIKEEHILSTAFNNYLLGKIQGYTPEKFFLINRDGVEFPIPFNQCEQELRRILEEIKEIVNGKEVTPTKGTLSYPWESFGLKRIIELNDISLIPEVGEVRKQKLCQRGIRTVSDLVNFDISKVKIDGVSKNALEKWRLCANAISQNKMLVLERPTFTQHKTEIFLDLEGTDVMLIDEEEIKVDYFIGLLVIENGKEEYVSFVAHKMEDEGKVMKAFLNLIKNKDDFVIYHYSSYEKTRLRNLFEKYGVDPNLRMKIEKGMIDLLSMVKKCVILPVYSHSLKDVAKHLGFTWRGGNVDAQESIALYLRYLEDGDKEKIDKIIQYNEDDCRATKIVKDFLSSLSSKTLKN